MTLQEQYDASSGHLVLGPGEYQGPLVISRPQSIIEGNGATIWADRGPVIQVRARDVQLKNLRAEIMEDSTDEAERTAIHTLAPDTVLKNVEVYGDVAGPIASAGTCLVPRTADFGAFASDKHNTFLLHIDVPERIQARSNIAGVSLAPHTVGPGPADIVVMTEPLPDGTNLYGELLLDGDVRRRIYIRGIAQKSARHIDAAAEIAAPVPTQRRANPETNAPRTFSSAARLSADRAHPKTPPVPEKAPSSQVLQRGQRIALNSFERGILRVQLNLAAPVETDAFIFALAENERVRGDEDFVFYGHPRLDKTGAAEIGADGTSPYAQFALSKAPSAIQRFVVAFSLYADAAPAGDAFHNATFTVLSDSVPVYSFAATIVPHERTMVAAELYRYKGRWKLFCADQGLTSGIDSLCDAYGVDLI